MQDSERRIVETIERFSALVRKVIGAHLHKNDSVYLEDIEQEVKLKIWDYLKKGKEIQNLASYIRKVAYSTTIDELRKMRKQAPPQEVKELKHIYLLGEHLRPENSEPSPQSFLEEKEWKTRIQRNLECLGSNRKQVLRLYLDGFSIDEICEFFGWDQVKVRHLLYRGIDELKKLLLEEDGK
jgi:RNA polymerase sigma-70 factor (ECF subfamily)